MYHNQDHVQPCRELAYQIADQFRVFSRPMSYKDCIIVGGVGKVLLVNATRIAVYHNQI